MQTLSPLANRDLLSIGELTESEILEILNYARQFLCDDPEPILKGCLLGSCFYEPSTRTRLSFEAAMKRLGGEIVGFSDWKVTSQQKEEALSDSIRVIGQYVDAIVIRHPLEGAAVQAADATDKPVINGGDGSHQHPTQTLIDLMAIQQTQGQLEDLKIGFMGDLKYSRAVQTLVQACSHFGTRMYFLSPKTLEIPKQICEDLKSRGIIFSFHNDVDEVVHKLDILYLTRLQKERIKGGEAQQNYLKPFRFHLNHLHSVKQNFRILHPLPRVDELDARIDQTEYAYYFEQSKLGIPVRQAVLSLIMGRI